MKKSQNGNIVLLVISLMALIPFSEIEALTHVRKVGVLVAMEKEMRLLQDCFHDTAVVVRLSGIGKVNAALNCAQMIRECHPDVIISMGCAGGNGDDVRVGDIVASSETTYYDVYCGDGNAYGQVQGMPERYVTPKWLIEKTSQMSRDVRTGLFVSGDWFVTSKEKMTEITSRFPNAIAVDMESAAIAQVCHVYGLPFISIRIISDKPTDDEHGSQYANFWNEANASTFEMAIELVEQLNKQDICVE